MTFLLRFGSSFFILFICLLIGIGISSGNQISCAEKEGIKICASFHGSSPISALVPGENVAVRMDIFYVHIENNSSDILSIASGDFSCVNVAGDAVVVDEPLSEKIKWSRKLVKTSLSPGQTTEGYIFCPGTRYPVRVLTYHGKVILGVHLF
ncbi:MAG: hypothetical protein WHS38_03415 [Thermodesulforhabdaceae bacterium]